MIPGNVDLEEYDPDCFALWKVVARNAVRAKRRWLRARAPTAGASGSCHFGGWLRLGSSVDRGIGSQVSSPLPQFPCAFPHVLIRTRVRKRRNAMAPRRPIRRRLKHPGGQPSVPPSKRHRAEVEAPLRACDDAFPVRCRIPQGATGEFICTTDANIDQEWRYPISRWPTNEEMLPKGDPRIRNCFHFSGRLAWLAVGLRDHSRTESGSYVRGSLCCGRRSGDANEFRFTDGRGDTECLLEDRKFEVW